jgi:chromosome segregation protein
MRLESLEINGFKSFAKKTNLDFLSPVVSVVGPNGSGKSNVVEAFRFVLGEQSIKSMRGKAGSDLIFKGSKFLPKGTKASVNIYFNNKDRVFRLINDNGELIDLNFDTISIGREVYVDGYNKYILNGSEVRLKDIHNVLSSLNIGSSGHHIISQGEADRILNASSKERREMIEDALGLKIFQHKIKESERKLEKTSNNMKEVVLLRRENAPHLNYLKKQVEKYEKAKELRVELIALYKDYINKQKTFLKKERNILNTEKNKIQSELDAVLEKIENFNSLQNNNVQSEDEKEISNLEQNLRDLNNIKNDLERKIGRIEGMIDFEEKRIFILQNKKEEVVKEENIVFLRKDIEDFVGDLEFSLKEIENKDNVFDILNIVKNINNILSKIKVKISFGEKQEILPREVKIDRDQIDALKKDLESLQDDIRKIQNDEISLVEKINNLKNKISVDLEKRRLVEKESYDFRFKQNELNSSLSLLSLKEENLIKEEQSLEVEINEGIALVGNEIIDLEFFDASLLVDKFEQDEKKRKIERIKIKLEEAGIGSGADLIREYEEVSSRDVFLAKELEDLEKSIESLKNIIAELKEKIDKEFKIGVEKINKEFQDFFALMFGGGEAFLSVIAEHKKKKNEEDADGENELVFEHGVEIDVALPHKKVKELHALSGGERSLTSIALLFAMSQVNPPPFLILDETDAALDEANSRKYGDMLERLSSRSQLVVVTHNRETMSRAGILYGVTVGAEGSSKLLSVKFDEAVMIAK